MASVLKRNMAKPIRFSQFGILILLLLLLPLHVLRNRIPAGYAEGKEQSLNVYPTTPEGVVEAFCRVSFDAAVIREIVYGGDVKDRIQYTTLEGLGGCDGYRIALNYKIIKLKENADKSIIKVVYECIGNISALEFLTIERKAEEVVYHLKKEKDIWKIVSPYHCPYISVRTAIELSDYGIKIHPELKEKITKNINILKRYL